MIRFLFTSNASFFSTFLISSCTNGKRMVYFNNVKDSSYPGAIEGKISLNLMLY